ncbi:amidohydrolase [Halorussus gelatinilyticus]|uniref:Amidohydrolase n=1 Tax=Halorussus gelatinilyticus TaxID=2937524 RepID=A0A8U0IJW0_9EURY|nr:amidohydrolase [Halorussus gelatinilyticus]UPW00976.1 amidohydrolase [Halorussus gelatinilyticus]
MTAAADCIFTNAEVRTLDDEDTTAEAVAVRDGEIVRVGEAYELDFLNGVETEEVDLGGRVLLPGFIDAHTHLSHVGRSLVYADLAAADSPDDSVALLADSADDGDASDAEGDDADDWILGFGYDESTWEESRYLTREDLDRVSTERPVAAFREDMHIAAVNSVALDRYAAAMPDDDVQTEGGDPTGVVVEEAVDVIYEAIEPDADEMRTLLDAAQREAHRKGVTGVHDMVRQSRAPAVYRQMELDGDLALRVRINYWSDHLDAVVETGLRTNHGSEFVRTGAIKTFTDGSLGGRTAKLSEPYADADESETGQWVVAPDELRDLVGEADDADLQLTAHAIGDEAVEEVLSAYEETGDPAASRHRVEHAELVGDESLDRFADSGVVASVQPNFLKWAQEGGLYDDRLGSERRERSNRYADLLDAGAHLAFGSDCMPMDPLFGVHQTVNAPEERQRLSVTEALRAYTRGAAYAGFDEDRLGTVEAGKKADFTVLERSPWDHPEDIESIDVAMTVVDGDAVYDTRN